MSDKCRICKTKENEMFQIFEDRSTKFKIVISCLLKKLTGLNISHRNGLLTRICNNCLEKLENAYEFREICINAEKQLKVRKNNHANSVNESKIKCEDDNNKTTTTNNDSNKAAKPDILSSTVKLPTITTSKLHLCNVCGKDYKSKRSLIHHLLSHNNIKKFPCSFCDIKLCSQYSLQMHERRHTNTKPYICSYCGERFRTSGSLLMHSRKHTGELPYVCTMDGCNKAYPQSSELKLHIRSTHTGERNFQCDSCDKNFLTKQHLKQHHERNHEPKPVERNFECPVCLNKFFQKRSVTKHLKNVHKIIRKNLFN
ncbi:zinc finger protein 90 homolog [Ctenocephalides felis]|uniref:zinc finger protein 90 homolog n=1 Tax=Ctenocephalides felis TaxID=7515 RepID=UPI000E6E1EF3|nr:zinc finger protein 90 homolog [Ctenocephalides felis]